MTMRFIPQQLTINFTTALIVLAFSFAFFTFFAVGEEYAFEEGIAKRCSMSNWTGAFEYNNNIVICYPNHRVMVTSFFEGKQIVEIINFGGN